MKREKNIKRVEQKKQEEQKDSKNINFLVKQSAYRGPLPPPEMLAEYKKIYEDAPHIIFISFQKEQEHRIKTIRFGQISALIIGVGGLISTTLLGIYGNPWVAGSIGFLSLGSLVGAFLYDKNISKERNNAKE